MVGINVVHEKEMWKLRVHVLVVLVFICLILTVVMSFGNLKYRCILLLMYDVETELNFHSLPL